MTSSKRKRKKGRREYARKGRVLFTNEEKAQTKKAAASKHLSSSGKKTAVTREGEGGTIDSRTTGIPPKEVLVLK